MSQIKLLHSGGNGIIVAAPANNPASDITFKLPQADGSASQVLQTDGNGNLSWVSLPTGGLPMVDMWHVSSTSTFNTETAAVNWGRSSGTITGAGHIGSAMTNSTQYFTFPETGIYEVEYQTLCYTSAAEARYVASFIYATTDGSNYNKRARGYAAVHQDSSQTTFSFGAKYIFDVTNTSTHKVRFRQYSSGGSIYSLGESVESYNAFTFLRLGDT